MTETTSIRIARSSGFRLHWIFALGIACFLTLFINASAVAFQSGDGNNNTNQLPLSQLLYQSTIATAEKSLRLHELRDARQWLEHAPAELRGWEWHFLEAQCDESTAAHAIDEHVVTSIDVAKDGSRLAVANDLGGITLYDFPNFANARKIGDHQEAVYSVAFSDDATRLVTVCRDMTSRVLDVATGAEISRIKLDNPGVAEACFSPSGKLVSTCTWMMTGEPGQQSVEGVVWIWDADSGEVKFKKNVGVKPLDSMQWSSDGSKIVVGSWGGLIHVLDHEANVLKTLEMPDVGIYNAVISVAISPDGSLVAAGSKDRTARVWRLTDGELQSTMTGHDGFVNAVKFTVDGKQLVTASVDGTIRTWDVNSGKRLQVLHGHTGSVTAMDLAADDRLLVTAGRDQQLRTWDLSADYGGRLAVRIQPGGTYTTTFSPDGRRMYIACYDGHVRVLDTTSGQVVDDWVAHESSCNTLALSRDGSRLLTCSWDESAKVWNAQDHSLLQTLKAKAGIYDCAISPDKTTAALCVANELQIWDVEKGEQLGHCEGHQQSLNEVQFSPDGKTIATAAAAEPIRLWNADTLKSIATLGDESNPATTMAFSHDGKTIATVGNGKVFLWNSDNGKLQEEIPFGGSSASCLAFAPDDRRLAVAAEAIYIVDPKQGTSLLRFQPNDDTIYFLAFSPDGSRLASCTASGAVAISETTSLKQRLSQSTIKDHKHADRIQIGLPGQ